MPLAEPEPFASLTAALDEVPSPQSMVPVWVSRIPGSVKLADAVTDSPTDSGSMGAVIAPTAGATLAMLAVAFAVPTSPPPSLTVSVTG